MLAPQAEAEVKDVSQMHLCCYYAGSVTTRPPPPAAAEDDDYYGCCCDCYCYRYYCLATAVLEGKLWVSHGFSGRFAVLRLVSRAAAVEIEWGDYVLLYRAHLL